MDDGSISPPADLSNVLIRSLTHLHGLEIIRLRRNLGHQRAIAVGLADAVNRKIFDAVIVMDSDGEDKPDDTLPLLQEFQKDQTMIVAARRCKRSEGPGFRFGYRCYRTLFRFLTGRDIPFGNFCLLPYPAARRLIYHDHLWNHFAATLLWSRLPLKTVATARGTRYAGPPQMNSAGLILHGCSAMSVFLDTILLRALMLLPAGGLLLLLGGMAMQMHAPDAGPVISFGIGNALSTLGGMVMLAAGIAGAMLFALLARRNQRPLIPAVHSADYIERHEILKKSLHDYCASDTTPAVRDEETAR